MPKFIYTGFHGRSGASDGNATDAIVAFGLKFTRGVPVEVADLHAIRKLTLNDYFRLALEDEKSSLPVEAPEIGATLTPETVTQPEIVAASVEVQPQPLQASRKGRRKA